MKHLFNFCAVLLAAALVLVGCQSDRSDGVVPTVKLVAGKVGATTISFTVEASNASKCTYMLYDGDVITADTILAEGVVVAGDGAITTVEGLESETVYYVVAAASNNLGAVMSNTLMLKTSAAGDNGGDNGGGDNGGGDNGGGTIELPEDALNITKTTGGRWYEPYNYYVTLIAETGERIILDFYTIDETMSSYLPYGSYELDTQNTTAPFTIAGETSGIVLRPEQSTEEGYLFTSGYCNVDVLNGYYSLYFEFTYDVEGTQHSVCGYYNGPMSGTSVPGDDNENRKLLELLDVSSSSFSFRINAPEGQYWRCAVAEKIVYNSSNPNPGAWVLNYGFLFEGPMEIDWRNGEEFIPGYMMNVSPNTDYIILAVLVDSETGYDMQSGVEIIEVKTEPMAAGTGVVDVEITNIGANDVTFYCTMGEGVSKYLVTIYREDQVEDARQNWSDYTSYGINSFEDMMYLLITTASTPRARTFYESTEVNWGDLWYATPHYICIMVEDANGGASLILEPFETL